MAAVLSAAVLTHVLALLILLAPVLDARADPLTRVAGWVETVWVRSLPAAGQLPREATSPITLKAKLDTGADHSSLHAEGIEGFREDGREWVRFRVPDESGRVVVLVRPLVRQAFIRRAGGETQPRPVVRLALCLGDLEREVEVNLVQRGGLQYRLLLGRSFLAGAFLVDSSASGLIPLDCPLTDTRRAE